MGSGPGSIFLFLKECCFRVRVRVRLGLRLGLGLGLVSTLTLTIILTLKQHSLNMRQTPTPAPAPNLIPTSSPCFTDTRLLSHKLCKNLHSSGVYTSSCNSGTVPVRSSCAPCRRSHVNERQIRFHKCLSVQNFVWARVKGVSL